MTGDVDRYLRRATRGLWGRTRRRVQAELRGAVEDRIWRHQVAGCEDSEAVRLALQDMGDASTTARELSAVHTLPRGLQLTAVLALLAALSTGPLTRTLAQVQTVPLTKATAACDQSANAVRWRQENFSAEELRGTTPEHLHTYCQRLTSFPAEFVDRDSLVAQLRSGGAQVTDTPPVSIAFHFLHGRFSSAWRFVTFPGTTTPIGLVPILWNHRQLVPIADFIEGLLALTPLPMHFEGDVNPRVTVGQVSFVLGTRATPLNANLLRSVALMRQLGLIVNARRSTGITYSADPGDPLTRAGSPSVTPLRLHTSLPEGTLIGVLLRDQQQHALTDPNVFFPEHLVYTAQVRGGAIELLPLPGLTRAQVTVTDSFTALARPFQGTERRRVLLLQLQNTNDLRNITYLVVPPTTVR
ncbi:hypothetical protein [Deinococcus sonorensis]|uniref:Uncharacterized protein n=1 Tax=Deinococcus sonorensis TaxID=309891 RepID=A0ABV8Y9Z5_9DEIO